MENHGLKLLSIYLEDVKILLKIGFIQLKEV